ncbi:leucine-rich repeat-containing protein 31 [Oncorhynchus keta]|uniref:leucine-rich repeat-containing protein 31 n=1 Tax=Oncorhynchus keta TaxID=8018 RepID=UPI0015F89DCD|nr:leucine-rich repeat-containing protein 31 [Oncorhynchus keta]XP_035597763.1 leucine-rich repeat-containing protein 31 [Oncorhynchus keta]XP_035597765.1 leucine-rich repeat-containing protein 31 [Oncorhynchus keta]XP_035597766.1 leucine-rich repeat-containing protein 31 [Oncorhynchus keta]
MESSDVQRGRGRSPFDLIMNQIRRKRTTSDRKSTSGRFLSRQAESGGLPEDREAEEERDGAGVVPGPTEPAESVCDMGWGRVCVFVKRLGKRADSRTLSLAHCDLTATDVLELATLLPSLSLLEEMDLSWNELIGGCLRSLTSHLQNVGGLRTLRLSCCRLTADDITALGEALKCVPVLEVLDLSWNAGIGGSALQGIMGKLHPTLRELYLVACQLTETDATILGGIVSVLPRLCVLDVSCNPLLAHTQTDAEDGSMSKTEPGKGSVWGLGGLVPSLSHTPSLTTLRLHDCGLTTQSLGLLGGSFHCLRSLCQLDLSCNKGVAGGLSLLSPHLALLSHLGGLDLHLCCLTHTDLQALIQALPSLTELTELDLSSNKEVGGVVSDIVSALPLSQIKLLPLNGCSLNQESLSALALAMPYLQCIDVSWSKMVGGRLALLLEALQPSATQELRLSSCDLTTDDLLHLAVVCKRGVLSSLRVLDLSYNGGVGEEGWCGLLGEGGLGSLEELDLSLRPLTSKPSLLTSNPSPLTWLPTLLSAFPHLPALTRLSLQRWTLTAQEREQVNHALRKRKVLLELDPVPFASSANQEGLEEERNEE